MILLDIIGFIISALFIGAMFSLYMLPTIYAYKRQHHATRQIFILNLCFGWSLLGYVAALIWAVSNPKSNAQQLIDYDRSKQL